MKFVVAVLSLTGVFLISGAYTHTAIVIHTANPQSEKIKWLSWEEVVEKSKYKKKKIVVDVYTQWCGWCKRMDQTTFTNPFIISYVNQHYYPVKFDAETKADILFNGKTYRFVKNGMRGYHELAAQITRGRLSYPTFVFLDETFEVIQSIPGYRSVGEFETILTYFGTNSHKTTPWESYHRNYLRPPGN